MSVVNGMTPYEGGIENDIDGGLPFWPHGSSDHGEKYMTVHGKEMKLLLSEKWFAQSKARKPERKTELMQFIQTVKDNDYIIVMIK